MTLLIIFISSPLLLVLYFIHNMSKKREKIFKELAESFKKNDESFIRATKALDRMIQQQDQFLIEFEPRAALKASQILRWAEIYKCVAMGERLEPIGTTTLGHNAQLDYARTQYNKSISDFSYEESDIPTYTRIGIYPQMLM